jgi:hypothetical protein
MPRSLAVTSIQAEKLSENNRMKEQAMHSISK